MRVKRFGAADVLAGTLLSCAGRAAPGGRLGRQTDATLLALEGKGLAAGEAVALEKQVAGSTPGSPPCAGCWRADPTW